MKMPGGQTEMKMPVRERRGTVQFTPEQIQQIQRRTEKIRKGDGKMRKGCGKLSSWWKNNKSKILKGLAIGANVGAMAYAGKELYNTYKSAEDNFNYKKFMESKPPYSWTEEKGWELSPEKKGGSFWKKHKSKILGTLALGTTLGATALIGKKINDDIRSQPVLQPLSYTIPGYDAHIDRMSQLASGLSPLQWQERKYLDESAFDAPPSTWGSGSCCRACKMKKGKCKKGKGWWSDNKAKILGGISGAATLAGMAYVGNKLYGSKSNEPGNLGQMEYDPSKYSHLDVGYEDV
jgi:hypothetical protein